MNTAGNLRNGTESTTRPTSCTELGAPWAARVGGAFEERLFLCLVVGEHMTPWSRGRATGVVAELQKMVS